jgi:hypothetical protein
VTPHICGSKASVSAEVRRHAVANIPDVRKEYLDNVARIAESGGEDDD